MKIRFVAGCEYYTNLLYPVQVVGKAFRSIRIIRSDGIMDTIPDRYWKNYQHYPLCFNCYQPSTRAWVWCIQNTVTPCRKHTRGCNPLDDKTLIEHIAICKQPACIAMRKFLEECDLWQTLMQFA